MNKLPLVLADLREGSGEEQTLAPNESSFYPEGLSKGAIHSYYSANKNVILSNSRGKVILVVIKSQRDNSQVVRMKDNSGTPINLFAEGQWDLWNTGRTMSYWWLVKPGEKFGWIRIHGNSNYEFEKLYRLAQEFAGNLREAPDLEDLSLLYDGDGGFYIYVNFPKPDPENVKKLNEWCHTIADEEDTLTFEKPQDDYHGWVEVMPAENSGVPIPYALNGETGVPVVPIKPGDINFNPDVLTIGPKTASLKAASVSNVDTDEMIRKAKDVVRKDVKDFGFEGDLDRIAVEVEELPEDKAGKTDQEGHIYLSRELFAPGMFDVLCDVLFHEFMHIKLRQDAHGDKKKEPETDSGNEAIVLEMERKRLLQKGLSDEDAQRRIQHRRAGLWGMFKKAIASWTRKLFGGSTTPQEDERNYDEEALGNDDPGAGAFEDNIHHDDRKKRLKPGRLGIGPIENTDGSPLIAPATVPQEALGPRGDYCDYAEQEVAGHLMLPRSDFKDKNEVIEYVQKNYPELKLSGEDIDWYGDEYVEYFEPIKKKSSLEKSFEVTVTYGDPPRDYEVEVCIGDKLPVAKIKEGQEKGLREEDISAIHGWAYKAYEAIKNFQSSKNIKGFQKKINKEYGDLPAINEYKNNLKYKTILPQDIEKHIDERNDVVISVKLDGIFVGIEYRDGHAAAITPKGTIFSDLPALEECAEILKSKNIDYLFGYAEMYGVSEEGVPLSFLKSSGFLKKPSKEEENRIHFIVFDITKIDGQDYHKTSYAVRSNFVKSIFGSGKSFASAQFKIGGIKEARELWKQVEGGAYGYEGLVLTEGMEKTKVKPVLTFDLALIGVERSEKHPDTAGALVLAFMDTDGKFRYAGKVGTGLSDPERASYLKFAQEHAVEGPESKVIWIKPDKVVEVKALEANIQKEDVYIFEDNRWVEVGDDLTGILRQPRLDKVREDKSVTPVDLRLTQIPNFPEAEAGLRLAAYAPEHPNTIIVEPNSFYPKGLNEQEIWEYYNSVGGDIVETFSGKEKYISPMISIKTDGSVFKRHGIDMKTRDGFDRANSGRMLEVHYALTSEDKMTTMVWCDIDPGDFYSWEDRISITLKIYRLFFGFSGIKSVDIRFSGSEGFHVIGWLEKPGNVDEWRKRIKTELDAWANDGTRNRLSTGIIRDPSMCRLDVSTLKYMGGLRAPFSLGPMGLRCMLVSPAETEKFQKKDATITTWLEKNSALEEYEKKRKFDRTPEPKPKLDDEDNIFVIQKHSAKKAGVHFDFRISEDGVLKSWAVRNLDQLLSGDKNKVLAVHVEDHPLSYANFEGEIPEGYGAGKVEIFDRGTYQLISKKPNSYKIHLMGEKMNGIFILVRMNDKHWLLMPSHGEEPGVNEKQADIVNLMKEIKKYSSPEADDILDGIEEAISDQQVERQGIITILAKVLNSVREGAIINFAELE